MALQPVDMQALFNQFDTLGKEQNALQQGLTVQENLQQQKDQLKTAADNRRVKEARSEEEQDQAVKDATQGGTQQGQTSRQADKNTGDSDSADDNTEEKEPAWEPYLGRHVDISS
jgi:hypothetical protein